MSEAYGIYLNDELKGVSTTMDGATKFAEDKFGSRQDGICINGVEIRKYEDGVGEVSRMPLGSPRKPAGEFK